MEEEELDEYYLAIRDNGEIVLYESEKFKLSTIDLINLIKICLVQKRAVSLGRKILEVYKDSTRHKEKKTFETLKKIGLNNEEEQKPTRSKKSKSR